MLVQVTAAVLAAVWAGNGQDGTVNNPQGMQKATEDQRTFSKYQLVKLKGFCCVRTKAGLPEIWDYFKSTKEVHAQ